MKKIESGALIEQIGLDQVRLTGLQLLQTKPPFDETLEEIAINHGGRVRFGSQEQGLDFSHLTIDLKPLGATLDARFTGESIGSRTNVPVVNLTLTVADTDLHNLQNMMWHECYEKILLVQAVLEDTYGVVISLENAKFSYMEICTTFHFAPFDSCRRFLNLVIKQYPNLNHITDDSHCSRRADGMTVYSQKASLTAKNKTRKIKFYDKSYQLYRCHGVSVPKGLIRVEYTLDKPKTILKELGENRLAKMEEVNIIDCFFTKVIAPAMRFANDTYEKRAQKYIKQVMAQVTRSPLSAACALSALSQPRKGTDISTILDICELQAYLQAVDRRHCRARYKTYRKLAEDAAPNLLRGDYARFHTFVNTLKTIYDSMVDCAPNTYRW